MKLHNEGIDNDLLVTNDKIGQLEASQIATNSKLMKMEMSVGDNSGLYSSNPRRVGIYNAYTRASRWVSIHTGSIYSNTPPAV